MPYVPLGDPWAGPAQFWMAGAVTGYWFEYTTKAQLGAGNAPHKAATNPTQKRLVLELGPLDVSAALAPSNFGGVRGQLFKVKFVDEGAPYDSGAFPDADLARGDRTYEYSLPSAILDEYVRTLGAGRTCSLQIDIDDPFPPLLQPWAAPRYVPVLAVCLHAP